MRGPPHDDRPYAASATGFGVSFHPNDGSATVAYTTALGATPTREASEKLPFKATVKMTTPALLLIAAVRISSGDGTIGCKITVNGTEVVEDSRDGANAAVSCTKTLFE